MIAPTLSRLRLSACISAALVFAFAQPSTAQKPFNLAAGPDTLFVSVNNIAIAGEYALRGKTANFHYPVLSMLSLVDSSSRIVTGLADTVRWLNANETAENGLPITQIWPRLFEYHRDNPLFPPNPDLYQSSPGVSFTEVREWQNFPTSTMLVMDVSGSMQDQIDEAKDANLLYVNLLRTVDRAGVIQFDNTIRSKLAMTNNLAQVRDSINIALPMGGTAIYDALALALQATKNELGRRRVVILYTDGNDNASTTTPQAVIDSAQALGIPIYTVALGFLTSDSVLARISSETGGLFFKSPTEKELASIYVRLSDIVQNFYVMAHGSPDPIRNNTWRTVDVTASLPTRNGRGKGYYFVGAQPQQRATDVALTFTSITDTQVVVNNRSVNAVKPGGTYRYRVRLHNRGPAAASNLRVRQFLPDSVRLLAASRPPLFTDGDSLLWQISNLAAGAEDSILVEARLAANVPNTLQELFSSALLFVANDTTPANNAAFDTVRVLHPQSPPNNNTDLALAMASFTDTSIVVNGKLVRATKPGSEYEYRLKLRNRGPKAASNIRLRQLLPDSVSFVRASLAPSFVDKDSLAWQMASLQAGNEDSINVTVRLAANVPRTLAQLLSEAQLFFANDTTPGNNAAFDTVRVLHPAPPPSNNTDLALAMNSITDTSIVVNGRLVRATKPGSGYEYRLKIRNRGPRNANNIRVRQLLPDSVSFVRASRAPLFVDKDSLAWQMASLQAGNEDSISVTVKLASNVPLGLALLSSEAKLFFANDTTPGNNAAFDTVRVLHPAPPPNNNTDLAMSLASFTDTSIVVNGKLVRATKPGSEYEYRLKVRNHGPRNANNIRVRQLLPDSVSFVRSSRAPFFVDKDSLAWQVASLQAGNEDSINVTVRLAASVPQTLALLFSEAKLFFANDTTPANNASFDTVRVIHPTIPPNNNTDLALAMSSVTDTSIVVNGKLVRATKPGDEYAYRIKLSNRGPKAASNIRIRQLLPDSVSFVRASLAPAFFDKDSLAWQVASLQAGNEDSINVTVRLAANVPRTLEQLLSEAQLFFANDTTPSNNAAFDTVRVIHPQSPPNNNTDLALAMSSITDTSIFVNGKLVRATKPGDEYEYHIKLRNHGPRAASNIRIRQLLPDSVSFVRALLAPSFVDKDSLAWQVASLQAGNEDSISVTVKLASNVPQTLALLSSEARLFFANDTTPANNAAFDTVRVLHAPPPPLLTNIAITQRAQTDSFAVVGNDTLRFARPGETYRYRITVSNTSTVAAQNVIVTNFLPDSIRASNILPSAQLVTNDSLQWRFATLAPLSQIVLTFEATVAAQMPLGTNLLINTTKGSAANEDPAQLANNVSVDTVFNVVAPPPIPKAVLRVWQIAATDSFAVSGNDTLRFARTGETYRYTLAVSNESDNEALNVRLIDFLPDAIAASAFQPTPSFANNDSVRWALGNLAPRTRRSFTFNATVPSVMPVGTNLLINKIVARADNLDLALSRVSASDTVRNIVRPLPPLLTPLIEARPPVVNVGEKVFVRVQVLDAISAWDLWAHFADGGIDSSFADAFIAANPQLTPNVWHEIEPSFNNTRLVTAAKQEELRFEIRTRDRLQRFANASASVLVQSGNDMALDRNVYEPDRENGLNINFKLSSNRKARLEVYDLAGHYVTKLAEGEYNAGWNTHVWNGVIAEDGRIVGSGVYLVLLRAGEYESWKKVIIIR